MSKSSSILFKRIIFTCLHCVSFAIINKSLKFQFLIFNSNNIEGMSVMKKTKLFSFFFAFLLFFSLGATFIQPAQAASEKKVAEGSVLKKIKKSGELVVGTSADYPPLEFTASENGKTKYVGVDIELAKDIAKDLNVKLVIKIMSFDSLLVALETGKVDMVISAMTPTPERKKV